MSYPMVLQTKQQLKTCTINKDTLARKQGCFSKAMVVPFRLTSTLCKLTSNDEIHNFKSIITNETYSKI